MNTYDFLTQTSSYDTHNTPSDLKIIPWVNHSKWDKAGVYH